MGNDKKTPASSVVELVRVSERYRLARVTVIGVFVLTGLGIVCYTVFRIVDKPPWLELALAIVAALVVVIGPVRILWHRVSTYTNAVDKRLPPPNP